MWVSAMNSFIAAAAPDHFTLVPAINIGRSARARASMAFRTSAMSGERRGAWVRIFGIGAFSQGTCPMKMSMGISRKAGPGVPETACRIASSMYSGMR
jgi:hypothetical protein